MSSIREINQNFYNKFDERYVTEQEFEDIDVKDGEDGVGVQSIEQTVTSTEDGGDNEVTITLTNGVTATFIVKNGSKGADGIIGKDGKSAYEYAKENGYTGTEEEFAEVLASTDTILSEAKSYTDTSVAELVGTAPETLDTLEEVAKAIKENEDVVTALNSAIGSKANQSDLDNYYVKDEIDNKLTELSDSFSSDASNITYNDGTVADVLDDLIEATTNLPSAGTRLTGVLEAGQTTITFESEEITTDTKLNAVYTSIFDVPLDSATFASGSLTLTFPAQEEDMEVVAVINATMAGGVGIESIEQTVTSEEDDGENEITVTLTNGESATFTIQNGSKGSQGIQGEKGEKGDAGSQGIQGVSGKSAYDYAVDGGYEGTEADFAELINNMATSNIRLV